MTDVLLVTYLGVPDLAEDDRLLVPALARRGIMSAPAIWDDESVDWASAKLAVVRSTWDYHHRHYEFLKWVERASTLTTLWNPPEVLRWNSHKSYLRDLERRGVPIVLTVWLEAGQHRDLSAIIAERGWRAVVVKPVVSASAHATVLVTQETLHDGQRHLDGMLRTHDMMVQPYMLSVEEYGERSLILVDGKLTHAVKRAPALAAGSTAAESHNPLVEPSSAEIDLAARTMRATGHETLYARVDVVQDEEGMPRLMELELLEPSLFLKGSSLAVERLASAIARRVR